MMAFQATAEGGDRFAVVIDKGLSGEKNGLHANNGSIAKPVGRDAIKSTRLSLKSTAIRHVAA
jgi:hypothetical protein